MLRSKAFFTATAAATVFAAIATSANAGVIPVVKYSASDVYYNHGGQPYRVIDGSGMNGYNYTSGAYHLPPTWPTGDPSTWTATSKDYHDEWQTTNGKFITASTTDGQIAWMIFDLGSPVSNLDKIYIWNAREGTTKQVKTYNVFYATSPTNLPQEYSGAITSSKPYIGAYDFPTQNWTKVNSSALTLGSLTTGGYADGQVALGGVTAQYLAVEILTPYSSANTQVGLAEVGITVVPEPASLALLGLGGLLIAGGRRRRA